MRIMGIVAAVVLASAAGATGDGTNGQADSRLQGTWRVSVTPDPGGPPPSQSYHTYLDGGGFVQSNASEGPMPGHGTWERDGARRYVLTFEKFVSFNPLKNQVGTFVFKVKETIRVKGDTYTGRGEASFCDADGGQCIPAGCARTIATRIKAERPACP